MPCNSDHCEPHSYEIELSKVLSILDELDGRGFNEKNWRGYHPNAYNKIISKGEIDRLTAELCSRLKKTDVTKHSLEMQMWWRDHKKADAERIKEEVGRRKQEALRKAAIKKLTKAERDVLGI